MNEGDHYGTLQVDPRAEPEVIEAAYRRLARKYHPDRREVEGDTTARMQDLNAAYSVLRDTDLRAAYDRERELRTVFTVYAAGGVRAGATMPAAPIPARRSPPSPSRRGVVAGVFGGLLLMAGGGGLAAVAVGEYLDERNRVAARAPSQETITRLTQRARLAAGPSAGVFAYTDASALTRVEQADADVTVRDFIAEARFFVPYDRRDGKWDCGFLFRMDGPASQYRLVVSSDARYQLDLWGGGGARTVADGPAEGLTTAAMGFNDVRLVASGGDGYLSLNGGHVATLDLAARAARGKVAAATALFGGNALPGRTMRYERFAVLSLDE